MIKTSILAILVLSITGYATTNGQQNISQLNLLMPILNGPESNSARQISYTLEAYNGCYEWMSSQPDLLSIEEIYDVGNSRCASKAKVIVKARKESPNIVWIVATDKDTGLTLKCESKVANLDSIQIITKMRTIDIGDYETFELLGYDKQGNAFTTLEGFRFNWSIEQSSKLAKYVTFKDSSITATSIRQRIEDNRHQSDKIVMKGLENGHIIVSATPNEKLYSTSKISHSVKILIISPFFLHPARSMLVLPYSKIEYSLYRSPTDPFLHPFSNPFLVGKQISLPSQHHKWKVTNSKIGSINASGIFYANDILGRSKVEVWDIRSEGESQLNKQESTVEVIEPWTIHIDSLNCENKNPNECGDLPTKDSTSRRNKWGQEFDFILGGVYALRARIEDKDSRRIWISKNAKVSWNIPSGLEIISDRGNEIIVRASKLFGYTDGHVKLSEVKFGKKIYTPVQDISTSEKMAVFMPLKLIKSSEFINLPYSSSSHQTFQISAIGGSGNFEWSSSNEDVATVSNDGVITAKGLGNCEIMIVDKTNKKNRDRIQVFVSQIGQTHFVEQNKEFIVDEAKSTVIYSTDILGRRFTQCDSLKYNLNSSMTELVSKQGAFQEGFFEDLNDSMTKDKVLLNVITDNQTYIHDFMKLSDYVSFLEAGAITEKKLLEIFKSYKNFGLCSQIFILPQREGSNILQAQVEGSTSQHSTQNQKFYIQYIADTSDLDLDYFDLHSRGILLSNGSSYRWKLSGGPSKWILNQDVDQIQYVTEIKIGTSFEKYIEYKIIKNQSGFKDIFLRCKNISQTGIVEVPVTFVTQNLKTRSLINPISMESKVLIKCGSPKNLKIYLPKSQNDFLSTKRFRSTQEIENDGTISAIANDSIQLQAWAFGVENQPYYNFSTLEINWDGPNIDNNSTISQIDGDFGHGYNDEYRLLTIGSKAREFKLTSKSEKYEDLPGKFSLVKDTLMVKLINKIKIQPENLTILNHPDARGKLYLSGGSGKFRVAVNDTEIAEINYDDRDHTVSIIPKRKGDFEIQVEDLNSPLRSTRIVRIVNPDTMKLEISDELIESGQPTTARVRIFDSEEHELDENQLKLIEINLNFDKNLGNLIDKEVEIIKLEHNQYQIIPTLQSTGILNIPLVSRAHVTSHGINYDLKAKNSFDTFSKISPYPSAVVSSPTCRFSVQMHFGKFKSNKYDLQIDVQVEDPKIVKMQKKTQDLVTFEALKKGKTNISVAFMLKGSNKRMNEVIIPVKIDYVNGVSLVSSEGRRVHTNAPIRLIASPLIDNQAITPSWCTYIYEWSTKNSNTVTIQEPEVIKTKDEENPATIYNNKIAVNAIGHSPGEAEIKITLKPKYGSTIGAASLTSTKFVTFIEPIIPSLPLYIGSEPCNLCGTLILPPSSGYQLETNHNSQNIEIRNPCDDSSRNLISWSQNGYFRTGSQLGFSSVQLVDVDNRDNTRMLNIEVTKIHSLVVEKSEKASLLSTGGNINLKVSLQDEFGRLFPTKLDNHKFSAFSGDSSIARVVVDQDESHISLQGIDKGETLVYVHLEDDNSIFDVFKVVVGNVLNIQNGVKVHVGGKIQFELSSGVSEGAKAWSSSDRDILSINPNTGLAHAHSSGKVTVVFDSNVRIETEVEVYEVDRLTVNEGGITSLSNIPDSGEETQEVAHFLPINFYSGDKLQFSVLKNDNFVRSNLNLDCVTNHPDWFTTESIINQDIATDFQKVYCKLKPIRNYPSGKKFPTKVTVTASLKSQGSGNYNIETNIEINYTWGFIVNLGAEEQINLDQNTYRRILTIPSPQYVDYSVTGSFPKEFISSGYEEKELKQTFNIMIPENARNSNFSGKICLKLKNQNECIPIRYSPDSSIFKNSSINVKKNKSISTFDLLIIIVMALLIFIIWNVFKSKKECVDGSRGRASDSFHGANFSRMR